MTVSEDIATEAAEAAQGDASKSDATPQLKDTPTIRIITMLLGSYKFCALELKLVSEKRESLIATPQLKDTPTIRIKTMLLGIYK